MGWFDAAIDAFVDAYCAVFGDEYEVARTALAKVRSAELQDWMHVHAQNAGYWRANGRPAERAERHPRRVSAHTERNLFERDGYRCRYCGIRVFPKSVFETANAALGDLVFPIRGGNLQRHGIKLCFSATLDHVEPLNLGGSNEADNLVTACWCCNYGKGEYSLEQLGLLDPRDFSPLLDDWRGMTDIVN